VPIRGLIFDFGGVIVNMRWDVARELEQKYELEPRTLLKTLYDADDWRAVELGQGDLEDIDRWREAAHQRLEEAGGKKLPYLHQEWRDSWGPIRENLSLIRGLRPPYRISVLSNADRTLVERMEQTQLHDLFDDIISSADVGLAKPDERIYRLAAERLQLSVEECVFIDDLERNIEAARKIGMKAIHFRVHEGDKLAEQLAELGVPEVPAK
jgi:epoxide hydrolase-like predicted phosphatase